MPHTKAIRRFTRPHHGGINGPLGRYIIRLTGKELPEFLTAESIPETESERPSKTTIKFKGTLAPLTPLTNHYIKLRRRSKSRKSNKNNMRQVNIEFKSMDTPRSIDEKDHLPPITTTLTFSDYLCKWCLTYVGQRRQFCSADCAAQFKLCQRRRDQKQNLNISVDYYGNVKLSIQGLPISGTDDGAVSKSYGGPETGRRGRRRRRCKNCGKLLSEETDTDFCDETCQTMDAERTKREDFVNIFQQKEAAERRRIRKWLQDAQDQYTKQTEGAEFLLNGERPDMETPLDITSGPAALNPLPVHRTPLPSIETHRTAKETPVRSGGPSYSFRRHLVHHVPDRFRMKRDEVVTGGPVTLNPIPLRKGPLRPERPRRIHDSDDKRQLSIDLNWIPKFHS